MSDSPFELRLSQAGEWIRCAAYSKVNQSRIAIDLLQDTSIRDEGIAMHWVAESLMTDVPDFSHEGLIAPNGVHITEELYDGAFAYVQTLNQYQVSEWHIEKQLAAPSIHKKCGGKPDAFGMNTSRRRIILPDLKGGFVPVDVFPNWQLLGYLRAILDTFPEWYLPDLEVEFIIVQPRAYHRDGPIKRHVMRVVDCVPYFEALRMSAHIAMGDHVKAVAGPQCNNCGGRAACSVAHAAGMQALEIAGEPDMHDLPAMAIDYEMMRLESAADMIQARLTGLKAQATAMIRRGESLTHYALESSAGRLCWTDTKCALAMGDLMGYDLRKPTEMLTPTQALKKLPENLLSAYTERKRGEVKLVRFDSSAAVKAFSHLKD